ncbi:type III secretion system export apparatus subunit SctS [Peristeroidobacter agariperforans]|uniref:type III secretion system export apparatus subunit SctS n=1 Tax=Peristeroidobacter agariperforans TaxID=268404 RepID=UPI00101B97FA|nr:type III secretion system export apparatus subunit SctS [Peristeroidobacter agariperforans]
MELAALVTYVKQALLLVLWLTLPPVLVASIVGLVIAVLQAVTQVQDQTISFGIKLLATMAAIALTSVWLGAELMNFTEQLFLAIADIK